MLKGMGEIHGRHTGTAMQEKYNWLVALATDQYPLGRSVERNFLKGCNAAVSQDGKCKSRMYNNSRCHHSEQGNHTEFDRSPHEQSVVRSVPKTPLTSVQSHHSPSLPPAPGCAWFSPPNSGRSQPAAVGCGFSRSLW